MIAFVTGVVLGAALAFSIRVLFAYGRGYADGHSDACSDVAIELQAAISDPALLQIGGVM